MQNQRLDKYLQQKYPSLSRAYIKEQIQLGNFLVYPAKSDKVGAKQFNRVYPEQGRGVGKKVKPSYLLQQEDAVALAPDFKLSETENKILPNPSIKLAIIYEDDDVLVIDKPAGLSVHPRQDKNGLPLAEELENTLVSGLLAYYPAIANVGDKSTSPFPSPTLGEGKTFSFSPSPLEGEGWGGVNLRPGIVHRLDKDTSGVMIVAKNQNSFDWLKKQFKERLVSKKYLALACGHPKEKQGVIKTLLARAKNNPTKQKISTSEGKEAITEYQVIKKFKDYSLIEARPKTGRLHQIRVHLAHLGHPVAGDAKYGDKRLSAPLGLARQFLHAKELEIILPNQIKKNFIAPLPPDLENILQNIK